MKFATVPMIETPDWSALASAILQTPKAEWLPLPPTINAPAARASLRRFGLRIEPEKKDGRIVAWRICSML